MPRTQSATGYLPVNNSIDYPRFRWMVLLALCLVTMASTTILISPTPLMGTIAKSLNVSLGDATGAYMGIYNLFVALTCILGGIVCDRFGILPVMLFSAVMLTIPTAVLPVVGDTFGAVFVLRILQACGAGPILSAASPLAALWFPTKERGIVTGFQGMSVSLGIAIGLIAVPALYGTKGNWRVAIAWLAVGCILSLVVTLLVALSPRAAVAPNAVSRKALARSNTSDFRLACKQTTTWVGVVVAFCFMWVLNAFQDLTPAYLAIKPPVGLGFGPMTAGKLMMGLQIAYMAGAVAAGFAMVKIFRRRAKPGIALGYLLFGAFAVAIMFPLVYTNMLVLALCLMVAGFFESWVVPNAQAFIAMHYPAHLTGRVEGMWIGIGLFGGTAGVLVGATALRNTGGYHLAIIIVGIVSLIGLLTSFFMQPPKVFAMVRGDAAAPLQAGALREPACAVIED